jgi:hypothetical protein
VTTHRSPLYFLVSLFLFGSPIQKTVTAQSTDMNVPSTDVVAAKRIYLEMDLSTNYAWQDENESENYLPRALVGLVHNLEAGVNVSYTRVPSADEPIEVQPNMKWQFYKNEKTGTAAAAGCILFVPVIHRADSNILGQCYLVGSKNPISSLSLRFTAGAYALINARGDDRTEVGAIVGYEQPLSQKISFIVDWSSGDNRFGYISPAFYIATSSNSGLSTGYTIR